MGRGVFSYKHAAPLAGMGRGGFSYKYAAPLGTDGARRFQLQTCRPAGQGWGAAFSVTNMLRRWGREELGRPQLVSYRVGQLPRSRNYLQPFRLL